MSVMLVSNIPALAIWIAWFKDVPSIRGTGDSRTEAIEDLWSRGEQIERQTYSIANAKDFKDYIVVRQNDDFGIGKTNQEALRDLAGCLNENIQFFSTADGFSATLGSLLATGKTPKEAMSALMSSHRDGKDDDLFRWVINYLDTERPALRSRGLEHKVDEMMFLRTKFEIARKHARDAGKRID